MILWGCVKMSSACTGDGCTHMHDTDTFNEAPPLNA